MTFRTVDDPARPLRVIQVGAGGMGQAWLDTVAASPDVELVGIVDLDLAAARAGAARLGLPERAVGTDLAALAQNTRPDAVLDITVPVAHYPVTLQSLTLGLPVLGEKPAAASVAETLALAAASEVHGELFMVSQSRRYNDQLVAFKQHSGLLGRVGILSTQFAKAPHFGGFREQMDDVLLLDMAIHAFDAARFLLDADPVAVYCESYNPAWSWYRGDAAATAVFEFEGDVRYTYDGSWCSPGFETSWNGAWRVSGEHGTALWNGDDDPLSEVDGEPGSPAAVPSVGHEIAGSLAAFVRALRTGETPDGEVHSNVRSLAMVEAAIASTKSRRRVEIASMLDIALAQAADAERHDDVRRRLRSWGSALAALDSTRTSSWESPAPFGATRSGSRSSHITRDIG